MSEYAPEVIVFDVNETLLDLGHLTPLFARVFGDGAVMREWFAQLILYSQTITLAGAYVPFGQLGAGALRMVGDIKGVAVDDADVGELKERLVTMPAHADVVPSLEKLQAAGFRLATLTNSPPAADGGPLRRAGLEDFFEKRFSIDKVHKFKTAPETYALAAAGLGVAPQRLCLVACHAWDTLGAQLAGWTSALILREGNAVLPAEGLPLPTLVVKDMHAFASAMIERWALPR